ncbi:hypothetical protein [Waddlia chondrophila]|uniref:Secreted protein n=2 Tax=Waddlia chondrophila TaxID=71667 RepID=D6YTX4_WADCW|nr:hypothetical protein [Waddlia chondrophila]ADI37585.1 hypothetical protein wcw_0210 [Waddlia chondrophila WSU 86-1044]
MKRLLMIILLFPVLLPGTDMPETGTLVVTYQTDNKGDRLNRVRFWLTCISHIKNGSHKQTLYPQGATYVDDANTQTRMVVIEDLPPGDYSIDFVVPNLDDRFSPVPQRKANIASGETTKIDQKIKFNQKNPASTPEHSPDIAQNLPDETERQKEADVFYGKLIVSFDLPDTPKRISDIHFRLTSPFGETTAHPIPEDTVIGLETGKMVMIPKLPAGNYTLEFFVEGSQEALAKKSFAVQADRTRSVHQVLTIAPTDAKTEIAEQASPSLILIANTPSAEFELLALESGKSYQEKGEKASFNEIPTGVYELRFQSRDPFFIPPSTEKIEIRKEGLMLKEISYTPLGKIDISTNVNEAKAQITPIEKGLHPYKKEIREGKATLYLPEGRYRITFQPVKGHEDPEPVDIDVRPLQTQQINVHF